MPAEGIFNGTWYGSRCKITVSSSGTGYGKLYTIVTDVYDFNGNVAQTITDTVPLVSPCMENAPSFIPKNTVRVSSPLSIDNDEIILSTHADGIVCLCCGCTKLEEFDFTTDLIHNVASQNGTIKGNIADFAFFNCESLKTLNIGDYFSCIDLNTPYEAAANQSLCCFMGCKELTTITGVFNFADASYYQSSFTRTGWDDLKATADSMFYGCDKLTGVQIHLTGNQSTFMSEKVYEVLGLKQNQFVLV